MATDFLLPDLGEGLTDAEIVRWLVKEGDEIALNQVICEVETAKALVELPSPIVGTVSALRAAEGETVLVGAPIITFGGAAESAPAVDPALDTVPEAPDGDDGRSTMLVGYGPGDSDPRSGRRRRADVPAPSAAVVKADATSASRASAGLDTTSASTAGRVRAKPPVRRLASQNHIDLATVHASGSDGTVLRKDVEAALAAAAAPSVTEAAPSDESRVPIAGVRKRTAAAMVASAFTAPHVTEFVTVDVTPTVDLVARLREHPLFSAVKVTPLLPVAKALAVAVSRHPELNSRWDGEAQEIVTFSAVNLGIAVATPRGLLVPNIRDVGRLTLVELAEAVAGLSERARAGKTATSELTGGTISITNIGSFGIDAGTPIINPGEAAILCVGAIRRQPWEFDDQIALRSVLTLSLSFDHRLVDGFEGSGFLSDIARMLADPTELIARG